jgi:chromate transporter
MFVSSLQGGTPLSNSKQERSSYFKLFGTFFKIGIFVFGGGYAMIPLIQQEVVTRHNWMSEEEFIDMLAITQSAPGPVAVNAAIFIGYKMNRLTGAIAALLGTIIPSFMIILFLATFLSTQSDHYYLNRFFEGVRPAIVALILGVGLKTSRKIINSFFSLALGTITLGLLLILDLHPFLLILFGALAGVLYNHLLKKGSKEVS